MSATEYEVVSLANPTKEDFTFMWSKDKYTIKAGQVKQFPKFLAEHGAKHLAKKIMISNGAFVDKVIDGKRIPNLITQDQVEELTDKLIKGEQVIAEAEEEIEEEETEEGEHTAESLDKMNFFALKKLAAKYGEVTKEMKKPELIALILG